MLEPPRSVESITLELAALRTVVTFQANLISRLADVSYMTASERDLLTALQAEHAEIAAWAAGLGESFPP